MPNGGSRAPSAWWGVTPATSRCSASCKKLASFDEAVLVTGESGVGKESVAQSLHLLGNRSAKSFVSVNCPQFRDGDMTVSELFGHKKGSFTGAISDRKGCFENADGGSIFLDEVGDLHMSAQVMLLRALATGEFQPLGSNDVRRVNVRVVAATNRPLDGMILGDEFREDLYYRLRYFHIEVPPLRKRGNDWYLLGAALSRAAPSEVRSEEEVLDAVPETPREVPLARATCASSSRSSPLATR